MGLSTETKRTSKYLQKKTEIDDLEHNTEKHKRRTEEQIQNERRSYHATTTEVVMDGIHVEARSQQVNTDD